VTIGATTLLLNEGEWSGWVPLEFHTGLPGSSVFSAAGVATSVAGTVRLFLKQVHPKFELYISPINVDPLRPANPISAPADFVASLARRSGRFYTLGIPEDTKALRSDPSSLTEDEFLQMVRLLAVERTKQYHAALERFNHGFLFFYFGHTDQLAHIFGVAGDRRSKASE